MLNDTSQYAAELRAEIEGLIEPPYHRDLKRLAAQICDWPDVLERMNRNACGMVDWLSDHPAIKRVHWSCDESSRDAYLALGGSVERPGVVVTVELTGRLKEFYDHTAFAKGPSFGTSFTLLCPFMYLAHYDLVSNDQGRNHLRSIGIDPDLVRISFGVEPLEAIKEEFSRSLDASLCSQ